MGDLLETEAVVPILLFSLFVVKSFFQPPPFFFASIETSEKHAFFKCYTILDPRLYCQSTGNPIFDKLGDIFEVCLNEHAPVKTIDIRYKSNPSII